MVFPTLAWSTYRYAKKSSLNEETDGLNLSKSAGTVVVWFA